MRLLRPNRGPYATSSGLHLRSCRDRRNAPRRVLTRAKSRPLRRIKRTSSSVMLGPTQHPRRVLTRAKSGPLRRIKRTSSSVMTGPTQRPRRAFTQAKSGPLRRIKWTSSSVMSGPTQRPRRELTRAKSGPLRRIKRTSSSVTTISDGRGPCALNAARAHVVTYPTESHLEDYAPLHGGSIALTALRKHTRKKKSWTRRVGGKLTYITCQKQDTWVRLVKNLTLHGSRWEPRSLPREEKSTSPLLNVHILQTAEYNEREKRTTEIQTIATAHGDFKRSTSEACPHSMCKALLRRSTDAT
jgi:hypothetical protein